MGLCNACCALLVTQTSAGTWNSKDPDSCLRQCKVKRKGETWGLSISPQFRAAWKSKEANEDPSNQSLLAASSASAGGSDKKPRQRLQREFAVDDKTLSLHTNQQIPSYLQHNWYNLCHIERAKDTLHIRLTLLHIIFSFLRQNGATIP